MLNVTLSVTYTQKKYFRTKGNKKIMYQSELFLLVVLLWVY